MTKYLFEDYGLREKLADPIQAIVDESQIIEAIDDAHKNGQRIRVHAIGPCLLDWTLTPHASAKPATS
jgi:hypothetical protein